MNWVGRSQAMRRLTSVNVMTAIDDKKADHLSVGGVAFLCVTRCDRKRKKIVDRRETGYQLRAADTHLITSYTSYLLRGYHNKWGFYDSKY